MKFKIDDRIVVNGDVNGMYFHDAYGTVVYVGSEYISVNFDEDLGLHNCGGAAEDGHGWNISGSALKNVTLKSDLLTERFDNVQVSQELENFLSEFTSKKREDV